MISNSSGFDTASIAFLYATVPAAVADERSKPCELPATIGSASPGDNDGSPILLPRADLAQEVHLHPE